MWLIAVMEEGSVSGMDPCICIWDGPLHQMPAFLERGVCHQSRAHRKHCRMLRQTLAIITYIEVYVASQKYVCVSLGSQTP